MWWGVASALLANVFYSTGFVLEKRALSGLPRLSSGEPARVVRLLIGSPLWLGGSLALAAGFAAQLAVYRTLPIAAAQGIFVSGLVLLLLLSSAVLGESPSGRERRGVVMITLALLMVVASLQDSDAVGGHASAGRVLLICLPALAAGLWLYWAVERRTRRRHRLPTAGVEYGVAVGLLYGVSSLAIKGVSGHLTTRGIGDAVFALLRSPYPYLLLFTAVTGLVLSQTALQRCRASLIVPVCTTVTCLFTAALGTYVFGESLPNDPLRLALRLGGTALAACVLLMLPRHDEPPKPPTPAKELAHEA